MSGRRKRSEHIPLAIELGLEPNEILELVRDTFGVDGEVIHDEYRHACIFHADRNPSCDINLRTGEFLCLSCHAKGDLATFGAQALGKERREVLELLRPKSPEARVAAVQRRIGHLKARRASESDSGLLEENLHDPSEYESGPLTYLRHRGFTKRTCVEHGVRYVHRTKLVRLERDEMKTFEITHSIAIPIRDTNQTLLGWAYRATEDSASWQPRYLYTPGLELAEQWYGLDLAETESPVVICEGTLDAMWLHQNNHNALAILGSQVSPRKATVLRAFPQVVMFPDYDPAGYDWISNLGSLLHGSVSTTVCRYPRFAVERMERGGKSKLDPQDLPPKLLRKMIERAVPYQWWKNTERRRLDAAGHEL